MYIQFDCVRFLIGQKELLAEEAIQQSVHKIDQVPNYHPYQSAAPFITAVTPVPAFQFIPPSIIMTSAIQDCSLITPPDTPSSQTGNLSEMFGAPRRCSSREHKQTSFFVATDIEPENPRKRKRSMLGATAKITPRRMLKFDQSEIVETKSTSDLVPVPIAFLDTAQVCIIINYTNVTSTVILLYTRSCT